MATVGPTSASGIADNRDKKPISPDISTTDYYRIYMDKMGGRALNKHFPLPLISHLDALKVFLSEQQLPAEQIEAILLEESKQAVRKVTKYNIENDDHADRVEIASHVIKIVKLKLGEKLATKENVLDILKEWRDEVKKSQQIAAGRLSPAPAKAVEASTESVKVAATSSESLNKKLISDAMKTVNQKYLLAYLSHACKVPSAIAYEVRFYDINAKSEPTVAQEAGKIANLEWEEIEKARIKRLEGTMPREMLDHLKKWMEVVPTPLSYEQLQAKAEKRKYEPGESKFARNEGRSLVNGYEPQTQLNKQVAVALSTARRFRKEDKVDITRQYAENAEKSRVEMQLELGLLPVSHSRQPTFWGMTKSMVTGTDYQREFPSERVRLDEAETKLSFPERRAITEKRLETFCPLRQAAQAVRLQEKKVDPEKEKELSELCEKLVKIRLA